MGGINLREILALLGPSTGQPLWNILLYIIFIGALISLFAMPDKNLTSTLLVATVLLATVVAKLSLSVGPGQSPLLTKCSFGMLIVNIITFVFPALAAGLIRAKKKSRVIIPLVITGIFGFIYFFAYWFLVQGNPAQCAAIA